MTRIPNTLRLLTGSVYKSFGIEWVLIIMSMTIFVFGKGSVRQDYSICNGHSIDL